jgi:hypothetical protein
MPMRIEQKQAWVRFISPLIRGGFVVLAVMVPLSCSKQKSPDTQAVTSDQAEVADLKQQLAQLQANISKKNTELETIHQRTAPAAPPPPSEPGVNAAPVQPIAPPGPVNSGSSAQQAARSVIEQDIVFQLTGCLLSGSLMKCDLLLTNKTGDRVVTFYHSDRSRVIDDSGREFPATSFALGAYVGVNSVATTLPGNIPIRGQVQIDGITPGTKKIQLLELYCGIGGSNGVRETVVKFDRIDL